MPGAAATGHLRLRVRLPGQAYLDLRCGVTTAWGPRRQLYIDPAAVPGTYQVAIDAVPGQGFSIGLLTHDGRCPPGSSPGGAGIRKATAAHRQH